jgi:serine/threonine-protein kinase
VAIVILLVIFFVLVLKLIFELYPNIMTWNPGDKLQNGKYKIKKILGEGGFGITYQAYHSYLDTDVVIKTLNDKLRKDLQYKKFQERFWKESQILAKFSEKRHPHIVQVKDLFIESDLPCLVMELVRGESLLDHVQNKGVLSEFQAVQYIRQIGSAINLIHGVGLVHRDAHPGNIMLVSQNEAILIDFGIASELKPISSSTSHPHNPAFAPFEQMLGNCEKTVDIYTLAASLYYAVTGEIPQPNLYARSQGQSLISPQQFNRNISSKLNQAIVKGLEFQPVDRSQSIEEWLNIFALPPIPIPATPTQISVPTKYEKLQKLLAAGEWKEADQETARVMSQVAGREEEGCLDPYSINKFPCEDLRIIDKLWVKYSNGRFGFSVQKNIWLECGGKVDHETECKVGDRMGWRVKGEWINYDDGTFSLQAPFGYLPLWPLPALSFKNKELRSNPALSRQMCKFRNHVPSREEMEKEREEAEKERKKMEKESPWGIYMWCLFSRIKSCESPAIQEISVPAKYEKERAEMEKESPWSIIILQKLLAAGEWKEADQETARVMLQVAGREEEGWLDPDSVNKFPCEALRTIDQLWVKYSNGRFGFSVQKNIWLECGGKVDTETQSEMGDRMGWRSEDNWIDYDKGTFSLKAPIGHLPFCFWVYERGGAGRPRWFVLLSHKSCESTAIQEISVPAKYEKLQKLLAAGEWKEADMETADIVLQVAGRKKGWLKGWLDRDSIEKFPCEDLRTIDQLWVKYSDGRFGFSVQKNIWLECGGKVDYETERKVGDRTGWRVEWALNGWIDYENGRFNMKALPGHLPLLVFRLVELNEEWLFNGYLWCSCFASRAVSCNI